MSTLLLLHGFNNYYNRIRKPYPSQGYKAYVGEGNWREYKNINFFPNDGVTTTQTINFTASGDLGWDADYLVVFDDASTTDNPIVKSRWFVMEQIHNRQKQLRLTLRRDLLIDYDSETKNSTAYIEKGVLPFNSNTPDPAFYIEEDISFNECPIKQNYILKGGQSTSQTYIILYIAADAKNYEVKVQDPSDPEIESNWVVFPSNRKATGNAPYSIYYIPTSTSNNYAYQAAGIISRSLYGSGALYDIQLMPYKPDNDASENITTASVYGYPQITLYKASDARLAFSASFSRSDLGLSDITGAKSAKIANQCEKLRIYSPGMANAFEYTPFKANAYKTLGYAFDVLVTFKPISPYIHVRPNLRGIYNNPNQASPTDFDKDQRGLIVGGDYSLPLTTDQWLTYEANNKNYLNSFNREVESAELRNKIGFLGDITKAASGVISTFLNPFTMSGTALSAIGGIADVMLNEAQRKEALDLSKDQFNFSMQNIQALPTLLNRSSSFVIDSQIFPYIQTFTCSDVEKNIFADKLKWNGMKINRIGTISTYLGYLQSNSDFNYLKCKLIRCPIKEDQHIVSEIANELDKGFYVN